MARTSFGSAVRENSRGTLHLNDFNWHVVLTFNWDSGLRCMELVRLLRHSDDKMGVPELCPEYSRMNLQPTRVWRICGER